MKKLVSHHLREMIMKILLFANTDWYLYNFRLPLIKELRDQGNDIVLATPPGTYNGRLQDLDFRWVPIQLSRKGMNPLTEIISVFRIIRLYRQEKPNLVHHFTIKPVIYGSLAARITKVPGTVNAVTGLGYIFSKDKFTLKALQQLVIQLYKIALKHTSVIFQNPDDQKLFFDHKIIKQGQSYLIFGSGVDCNHFVPKPEKNGIPTVTFVGRMLWDKGVGDFVEAARILHKKGVQARFLLVGDTDKNPSSIPAELLSKWQADGIVEWWGFQEDMREIYTLSHVICLPSYHEGLPRVLTEAAASQRPTIATDIPGCRDVIKHGVNGYLVPKKDPPSLAERMQELIENPDLRHQFAVKGRELAEREFSIEKVNRETIEVYLQHFQKI